MAEEKRLTIAELIERKDEIDLIAFDNNVFIVQDKKGKQLTERDCEAALREYFEHLGFETMDV